MTPSVLNRLQKPVPHHRKRPGHKLLYQVHYSDTVAIRNTQQNWNMSQFTKRSVSICGSWQLTPNHNKNTKTKITFRNKPKNGICKTFKLKAIIKNHEPITVKQIQHGSRNLFLVWFGAFLAAVSEHEDPEPQERGFRVEFPGLDPVDTPDLIDGLLPPHTLTVLHRQTGRWSGGVGGRGRWWTDDRCVFYLHGAFAPLTFTPFCSSSFTLSRIFPACRREGEEPEPTH